MKMLLEVGGWVAESVGRPGARLSEEGRAELANPVTESRGIRGLGTRSSGSAFQ